MEKTEGTLRTRSYASCSSKRSKASSTGAAAAVARAKAEAAKARLPYAKKEMALKVEKAQLEATMNMFSLEQETAAAVAEAEVLEAAVDGSDRNSSKLQSDQLSATSHDPMERTKKYVAEQAKEVNRVQFAPALHQLYHGEKRQLHAEPATMYLNKASHCKTEHSQADADFHTATPNQTGTATACSRYASLF